MKKEIVLDGLRYIVYSNSMSEASQELNINLADISMCCHNIRVSKAGGYRWEFYE